MAWTRCVVFCARGAHALEPPPSTPSQPPLQIPKLTSSGVAGLLAPACPQGTICSAPHVSRLAAAAHEEVSPCQGAWVCANLPCIHPRREG